MLNHLSPIPLYHQLSDILKQEIRSGIYEPGDAIPSETRIAKHYHIGRPTVRQATELLVRKGLLERKRGAGTFVRHQEPQVDLFSLAGTSQAFLTKGIKTASRIIEPVIPRTISNDKINPFNGKTAFFLSRLTLVKDEPVLLEEFYLHMGLFKGFDTVNLDNQSLSQVVSEQYYLKPGTGRQTFKISFLSEKRSTLLGVNPSEPVLAVERTLDFSAVKAGIFSRLYCRTDRFAFSQTIRPEMDPGTHNRKTGIL